MLSSLWYLYRICADQVPSSSKSFSKSMISKWITRKPRKPCVRVRLSSFFYRHSQPHFPIPSHLLLSPLLKPFLLHTSPFLYTTSSTTPALNSFSIPRAAQPPSSYPYPYPSSSFFFSFPLLKPTKLTSPRHNRRRRRNRQSPHAPHHQAQEHQHRPRRARQSVPAQSRQARRGRQTQDRNP